VTKKLVVTLLALIFAWQVGSTVYAQSGSVNFIGSIAGTTMAANCGSPTTPSLCIVSDGVWVMQAGSTAWAKIGSGSAPTLTLQGTTKTLPASFTITAGAATLTAQ
jgi:hypothetical protein